MMAGGKELDELSAELEEFSRADARRARPAPPSMRLPRACTRGRTLHKH